MRSDFKLSDPVVSTLLGFPLSSNSLEF